MKTHHYKVDLEWTGNKGSGTADYRAYRRDHIVSVAGKEHHIMGSSDPSFLGDPSRYNPEELFLSSLSTCHMLWYLHLCSMYQVVVTAYEDHATGIMEEQKNGSGQFTEVTLYPTVHVKETSMINKANELHEEANNMCFIANSCNFKIGHQPTTLTN